VGSLIGVLTLISNDQQLRDLTFWSMGSLAGNHFTMMLPTLTLIVISCIGLLRLAKPLNLYLLGEAQAKHLGIDVTKLKKHVFIYTALCTGAAVAITGIIGFVGFIVPHIVRLVLGPDHHYLMPTSMLGGALLLSLADLFARTVMLPAELPIGLITSAIGGPFFLIMLLKTYQRRGLKMLSGHNLTAKVGKKLLLDDVNFTVNPYEVVVIIGFLYANACFAPSLSNTWPFNCKLSGESPNTTPFLSTITVELKLSVCSLSRCASCTRVSSLSNWLARIFAE